MPVTANQEHQLTAVYIVNLESSLRPHPAATLSTLYINKTSKLQGIDCFCLCFILAVLYSIYILYLYISIYGSIQSSFKGFLTQERFNMKHFQFVQGAYVKQNPGTRYSNQIQNKKSNLFM